MATPPTLPSSSGEAAAAAAGAAEAAAAQALTPLPVVEEPAGELELSGPLARLPVEIDVSVPVRGFRVRHLLSLAPGHVVESQWSNGGDLPVSAGDVQLAWSEFEVLDTQLAVRVTRLA